MDYGAPPRQYSQPEPRRPARRAGDWTGPSRITLPARTRRALSDRHAAPPAASPARSNSTFSNNYARVGPVVAEYSSPATTTITGSSFVNNNSSVGAVTFLRNSIFANQGENCSPSSGYVIATYNFSSDHSCDQAFSDPSNVRGVDPKLAPLVDNGGPTKTHALLSGSPAIDAGGTSAIGCLATDQRGVQRPQGRACDIGAFEVALSPVPAAHLVVPTVVGVVGAGPARHTEAPGAGPGTNPKPPAHLAPAIGTPPISPTPRAQPDRR